METQSETFRNILRGRKLPLRGPCVKGSDGSGARGLFGVAAALSLLVGLLIWRVVPAGPATPPPAGFDVPGALGLGAGLVALLLAVSKGATWGWGSGTTLGLFAGSAVVCRPPAAPRSPCPSARWSSPPDTPPPSR